MVESAQLSGVKRALLEKYLRGDLPHTATAANSITHQTELEATDSRVPMMAVQKGGSKRPFFFLHGLWNGDAYYCYPLAHDLGQDRPFYALEPYKFDGLPIPPPFEFMAAAHLKSLRAIQPEGPYLLGGWCNGGLVAYEIARQLHAEGQSVELLVLMDPMAPTHQSVRRALARFGDLLGLDQIKQLEWFLRLQHGYRFLQHLYRYLRYPHYRRLKAHERYLRYSAYKRLKDAQHWSSVEQVKSRDRRATRSLCVTRPHAILPTIAALRRDYEDLFTWMAADYVPDSYPGKVTFFWDSEEPACSFRREGWHTVTKDHDIELYVMPGNHRTCRTEHLPVLAELLRECVSKVGQLD